MTDQQHDRTTQETVATAERIGGRGQPDHVIKKEVTNSVIHDRLELGKNGLVKSHTDLHYGNVASITCRCGESFDSLDDAEEHMREMLDS